MKKLFTLAFLCSTTLLSVFAQDKTTVRANSSEISDNLDLRAVATIFGESSDLEDFEKRINDPKAQISNLDLNEDNYVDYLRVIESIEGNDHIIVIQSVIDKDLYQDVATIEVQKDQNNRVQVQVVGDVYMYGQNYIYEPVYVHTPIIYNTFWANNYHPYYSNWYWNYYPSYYTYWNPFPIFRYRNHINFYIGGFGHVFNYVNYRNCRVSYNAYYGRRANAYQTRYPNRSFSSRNASVANRYELDRTRNVRTVNTRDRGNIQPRIESSTRSNNNTRSNASTRTENTRSTNATRTSRSTRSEVPTRTNSVSVKSSDNNSTGRSQNTRSNSSTPRVSAATRTETPRATNTSRSQSVKTTTAPSRSSSSKRVSSSSQSSNTRSSSSSRIGSSRADRG